MDDAALQKYLTTSADMPPAEEGEDELVPWHPEEELLVTSQESISALLFLSAASMGRSVMLVGAMGSIVVGLLRNQKFSSVGMSGKGVEAHYV